MTGPVQTASPSLWSVGRLRTFILICLVLGVGLYTAVMFLLTRSLAEQFGPQVRDDLVWRVHRGAQELAQTADVAVAASDPALLREAFAPHLESKDVQAIVALDTDDKVILEQGLLPEPYLDLFSGEPRQVRQGASCIISWAPVIIEGVQVGRIALVVSTDRLTEAEALLQRSSLATLVGGLCALVLGFWVVLYFARAVSRRDAQLSDYAANLASKVEERTRELDRRNREMRLVLDNVAQGFTTVGLDGVMAREHSKVLAHWFGEPPPEATLDSYLQPFAPDFSSWLNLGFEQLRAEELPIDLLMEQLPTRFTTNGQTFEVAYTPVGESERPEQLLVVISNISSQLCRAQVEREQRELVALFQQVSSDRQGVEEFITEAAALVGALRKAQDPTVERRLLHTLKGNCAMYGLETYAELADIAEDEMAETGAGLTESRRATLVQAWKATVARVASLLGGARRGVIEIESHELQAFIELVRTGVTGERLAQRLLEWHREPVALRFERLGRQVVSIAHRLGKPEPTVTIQANGVRLDRSTWAPFWATTVHLVRNAMDHGIEKPLERTLAGKPQAGTLALEARRTDGTLVLEVADDGRGVDWERVRAKAALAGLPHETPSDLRAALLADGLTTRDQVSNISGRGVGLAAVKRAVDELGGTLDIESTAGQGTTLRFTFHERQVPARIDVDPQSQLISSLLPSVCQ